MQKSIVLVEDDKHLATGLSLSLRSIGYKVNLLSNAEDAYDKINELIESGEKIDLLITDIDLPKRSGIELLDQLTSKAINIPVIAISGYSRKQIMEDLIGRKQFNLVEKPFTFKQLKEHIEFMLQKNK